MRSFLLGSPFLFFVVNALGLLWLSRTGEGGASVWLAIPDLFAVVFLLTTLSLAIFVFFARVGVELKLGLICLHSFLSHSLFLLVWYPGRYGDPWSHLGETRYILKSGMPYAYSWMLQNSLWVDLVKFRAHEAIVGFFGRMFYVDVYWVQILLIPVLWSFFAPLFGYKVAAMLSVKKSTVFPVLAAVVTGVFPSLIIWGAVSVPNSLGYIFFFLSAIFLLLWMNGGGRGMWLLALLGSLMSFLVHPQPGMFAFMLLFFGSVIQRVSRNILRICGYLLVFSFYPLALYFFGASFSLDGLFSVANFSSFQSEISTILLAIGLVGLILGVRDKYLDVKVSLMFFVFYVTVLFEYYFTKYGMTGLPYGPGRILVMADFMLVPFVALGLLTIVNVIRKAFSARWKDVSLSLSLKRIKANVSSHFLGVLLIGLFLSFQATSILYQAYPLNEIVEVQPSAYELEAIQYIDSDAHDRYVVVCDTIFSSLAIGYLGMDYGYAGGERGMFGIPEFSYPLARMYLSMTKQPSIGYMQEAMDFANATVSYFVVSVRNPDFDEVVEATSAVLPVNKVFGDGKLYVFQYPVLVREELGLPVKVVFDNGSSAYVETKIVYMVESEINATVTLSGHTSYNITDFPIYWTFLDLTVNNVSSSFDDSSDINWFVYVSGLESSDVLVVKWLFNGNYLEVGWKEDSFKKREWRTHELYSGTMVPTITRDGNILSLSYAFTPGAYWYYYYTTSVGISTSDYSHVIVRWRASSPVAIAAVYFETGVSYEIVPLSSQSTRWITTIIELPSGATISTVMVGLSNARDQDLSGTGTLEVDHILIVTKARP